MKRPIVFRHCEEQIDAAIQINVYCLCFARWIAASGKALLAMTLMFASTAPLPAHAFSLAWPVACTLGQNCFIQNFVDHDPSDAARDFTCAPHSYDGHDGTDIRLTSLAAMRAQVAVSAVADGTVLGTRDGVADTSIRDANAPNVAGRECGNGVRIQHADGYVSQSCHLMKGSIRVRTGQAVKAGDVIGAIGLSGQTEFPHLHLGLWKDKVKIEPFTGAPMNTSCDARLGATAPTGLWAVPVPYQPTALLNDGFTSAAPNAAAMRDTPIRTASMAASTPALIYWVEVMNLRAGDVLALSITAPDGSVFAQKSITLEKAKATYFAFIGKKNSAGKLAAGNYTAQVIVVRGSEKPVAVTRVVNVKTN